MPFKQDIAAPGARLRTAALWQSLTWAERWTKHTERYVPVTPLCLSPIAQGQGVLESTFEGLGARLETGAGASRFVTGL